MLFFLRENVNVPGKKWTRPKQRTTNPMLNYQLYLRPYLRHSFIILYFSVKLISPSYLIELCSTSKDNTMLVCRLAMWLICAFLRMVWGGGKGYSPSVRASTQPDTTVGTVRFRTQYLKDFSRFNLLLCPL